MIIKTEMKRFKRKKGPVNSKKIVCDGIEFKSGLEKNMHLALKAEGIKNKYEGESYIILPAFNTENSFFERQSNGKGILEDRGNKKVQGIKYTPDFIGDKFIIECKGRPNDSFPLRWKLFKKHVSENDRFKGYTIYKPQTKIECEIVAKHIKDNICKN